MTSEVEISLQTSFKKVWIFSKFSEPHFWTKEVQIDTVCNEVTADFNGIKIVNPYIPVEGI